MRLPRRVPWSSLTELDQICSWIYSNENDLEAKLLAVQRLSAWRAITTLPHALESTLALLAVIVQDTLREAPSSHLSSHLLTRQAYGSALVRLVNGLVDPLQLGAYARSIASIASQLGLPAWLVELRHAATHGDLPSLEILRDAAKEAMTWLLHHYFIPALNPSAPPKTQAPPLRPLSPLIAEYKSLLKVTTRDASLRSQHKAEIAQILRDIERWVAEAKVAADISAATLEWDPLETDGAEEADGKERWALDKLCDSLLEKGGLVPLSKKKRAISASPFQPSAALLAIWKPLLSHLQTLHPSLQSILVSKIIAGLLREPEAATSAEIETISLDISGRERDPSYDMCIASWAFWLISASNATSADPDDETAKIEEAAVALITGLGPIPDTSVDTKAARHLLDTLCKRYPALHETASLLLSASGVATSSAWATGDLQAMSQRLDALAAPREDEAAAVSTNSDTAGSASSSSTDLPRGWRIVSARDGWQPAPIGVHCG